jgi:methyltransferase-like protein/SAM-dependent methyltransferase
MFVNAMLLGLKPVPVQTARVLELGCGDASNLMAIAFANPQSQCVGIDSSGAAIADGRALAEEVGIENVSLLQTDVMEIGPDFGEFDYIIAHGFYSWVPPEVRDKLLEVCRTNLSPDGVAYVSYSVYPGAHFRDMYRGMMTYHVRQFADPVEKVRQAKGLLQFIAESQSAAATPDAAAQAAAQAGAHAGAQGVGGAAPPAVGPKADRPERNYAVRRNELYQQLIRNELNHMANHPPALVYHDDLSTFNQPVYFHEFVAHAGRHELQYLCEAEFIETQPPVPGAPTTFPPEVMKVLEQVPATDVIAREQYVDFLKCRQFRQSLLCHSSAAISRPAIRQRVTGLYAASPVRPLSANPDLRSTSQEAFEILHRGTFGVAHPMAKAALIELGSVWPARLHFDELAERCRRRLAAVIDPGESVGGPFAGGAAKPGTDPTADAAALSQALLTAYATNVIALHSFPLRIATVPSERPVASPLARAEAARRVLVSNLVGTSVDLSGPVPTRLIRLLDGTRDRDALARDLAEACLRDGHARARNGVPITDPAEMAEILRREMDEHLNMMARLALLVE